jgi:hypothetical protein
LNSAIIVKTWGHGIAKKHFKTWDSKSWKHARFQNCGCQVFKNISKWVHVLEDQVMKDIIHGKGLMLKFFTPKSFKTWKAKSWIAQSLSRLGDMGFKKNVTFQNLGSKPWKNVRFQNCGCQVLKNISKCVHVLEDQVMKDIIRGKGLMLKVFTRKFQDLESQVLNRAIIVKSWGHGVAKK